MAGSVPDQALLERSAWYVRWFQNVRLRWAPYLGWIVLVASLLLTTLPAAAIDAHNWIQVRRIDAGLTLAGPAALLLFWFVTGWRAPRRPARVLSGWQGWLSRGVAIVGWILFFLVVGLLTLSQLFLRWLPSASELWQAALTGEWFQVISNSADGFLRFFSRYVIWWQGIRASGAVQDDLVFAGLAGLLLWANGLLTAWLARSGRSGLVVAAPSLWMAGLLLIYTPGGRMLMAIGLALAVALQVLLDQTRLIQRWSSRGYDFSGGVVGERYLNAAGILLAILAVALLTPNISVDPVASRYYEWLRPLDARVERIGEQLFPDMTGSGGRFGRGIGGGMPNEFLLSAGSDLGSAEVMRVRTSDAVFDGPPGESLPPPGHYMRSATYANYDGLGWGNFLPEVRLETPANERWTANEWQSRKTLLQSVVLTFYSSVLYAAPEPVETTSDYTARTRSDGDLVALAARTRSYNVLSSIPAVSEESLARAQGWGPTQPLAEPYQVHLSLPDTVTDRTRELALALTEGLTSPHEKARAIETFLRAYEYDLTVSEPPAQVTDVADYFLFDLQRGYCDYYATAFVVLARLAGLPARFATGYAVGSWDPFEGVWIVSEAEAHSWPEVLFPEYGWIPFEPTAGRPELVRIGLPEPRVGQPPVSQAAVVEPIEAPAINWNWQMALWLLPLALAVWAVWTLVTGWRARRQDPWLALLAWGRRAGRPMGEGETAHEYGGGLAEYVLAHQTGEPDTGRFVAREVRRLSDDIAGARYAPEEQRSAAVARAMDRWSRLRVYLQRLRMRKDR